MQSQKIRWKGYLILIDLSILFCLIDSGVTKAQITPDNTLPNNSVVNPLGEVQRITGGTQSEANLFHSFEEFSVPTGGTAYFDNAINVENIISRVTGKAVSNIDGFIQANGTANLFLLNPNGIIFGPNSRLNIGGSFIGSTASSINFADGTSFSATNPQAPPLLRVSRPIGLHFESNSGTVKVQGNGHKLIRQSIGLPGVLSPILGINSSAGLEVESGKTLALIGNNLILEGGILTSRGGRIELGSVEEGAVGLTPTLFGGWTLEYDNSSNLENIQLSQRSFVGVYGADGGTIRLRGANVFLDDVSVILNQNQGSQPSGELSVNASESLSINGISQEARLRSGLFSEAIGMARGGGITVSASEILQNGGAGISSVTYGSGAGGDITVSASEILQNGGAGIGSVTYGSGAGGDITVSASEILRAREVSPFDTKSLSGISTSTLGSGKGGELTILTNKLLVEDGAGIGTATYTLGKGGNITINTFEEAKVIGSSLLDPTAVANISSFTFGFANAGDIKLSTQSLILKNGGRTGSSTFASGIGGNVLVNADAIDVVGVEPRTFSPSVLDASTFASGNAGNLTINTSKLKVRNGGRVDTSTLASGNAGLLEVNASNSIEVSGVVPNSLNPSLIDSSANVLDPILQQLFGLVDKPSGDAGGLTLNTRSLIVKNGAQVTVKNDGTGNAGTLEINANSVQLDNQAGITASTQSGQGGNIKVNSRDLLLMRRGIAESSMN